MQVHCPCCRIMTSKKTEEQRRKYWLHRGRIVSHNGDFGFLGLPINNSKICACHHCDNPPCFTSGHLFAGTQRDNIADRHAKGKSRGKPQPGEKNGLSKLTDKQALEILAIKPERGLADKLGRLFGVSRPAIQRIWQRKTFKHLQLAVE